MKKEVKIRTRAGLIAAALAILTVLPLYAAPAAKEFCGPIRESRSYQQYRLRPVSDFSRLIYLIDRFSACNIEIVYDGHYFTAAFAARVARWVLATNYKKEPGKAWIMRWCNVTIPRGTPIYAKFPGGKFRLAREILTEEIEALDRVLKQEEVSLPPEVEVTPLAQFMVKSPAAPRLDPAR